MYLYPVSAQVNTITLFNNLNLSILYNIFLRILQSIKASSAVFFKKQASNSKLMSTWDNFKYRKNVASRRIRDIVKSRSIIIAF